MANYVWNPEKEAYFGFTTSTRPTGVRIGTKIYEFDATNDIVKTYLTSDSGTTWYEVEKNGTPLLASGTDTAAVTDDKITVATGFNHIELSNDDATITITFAVDESALTSTKTIVLKAGETFDDYISGTDLHFASASGTPSFRYVLR